MKMNDIAKGAFKAIKILKENNEQGYIVGGAVRDLLLDRTPHDIDIATSLPPEKTMELFHKYGINAYPSGIAFGTVTVMINGEGYEITTFRKDGTYSDGRHPDEVVYAKTIEEDLSRRDFTINAMAMDNETIIDPFGGQKDLEDGIIRAVGDADKRIEEDALRMMRAVRFAAKFGFKIEQNTENAILANAERIQSVSAERFRDEMTKILMSKGARKGVEQLAKYGLSKYLFPELNDMFACEQNNRWHIEDVGHHALSVMENVSVFSNTMHITDEKTKEILLWAALLHDAGKVEAKIVKENGEDGFYGHSAISEKIAKDICERLHFSNSDKDRIVDLVANHDNLSDKLTKVRHFVADHNRDEDYITSLYVLQHSDALAHAEPHNLTIVKVADNFYQNMLTVAKDGTAIKLNEMQINGKDLIGIGLKGKEIGDCLNLLYKNCLGNPKENDREHLLAMAGKYYRKAHGAERFQKQEKDISNDEIDDR